jgi:protein TonB
MSYQALLFCLDERLARVVTQVFSELDFTVEQVNEPFGAVKKLIAQRYDAVVVDCENEPNATLLFKSARNSASNQSSLALALVEGQAGVAKAYRIGANLVLTKPINVEQAKGTLRVARGLLRKNVDSNTPAPAAPVKVPSAPVAIPVRPAIQNVEIPPSKNSFEIPQVEARLPAMAASIEKETPVATPIPEVTTRVVPVADASTHKVLAATLFETTRPTTETVAPTLFRSAIASPSSATGAASAPAPARETSAPPEKKDAIMPAADRTETVAPTFESTSLGSSPSFGALDDQDSGDSGGSKKILIIAAVVLVAAALGYFGLSKTSKSSAPNQPSTINAQQTSVPAPSPVPANTTPSASTSAPVPVAPPPVSQSKPSASVSTGATTISPDEEVVTRKVAPPAIVVKSPTAAKKQPQGEDATPQMPNPLAVASANDKKLSGLVAAVPSALPTRSLETVKISQGVSQGLLIKRVQPRYPQNALSMRIQGAVLLEATINKEGNIGNLKVVSGDPVLARAAADAVRQWRYKPYYLNGEPVDIETQITINFKLPN